MERFGLLKRVCFLFLFCVATTIASPTQTFTTLHSFGYTDGAYPFTSRLIQATDGNLYGTTTYGGTSSNGAACSVGCGTVFKITPAGTLTSLYSFCSRTNCTDGSDPYAGLIQATDGNFYGTTYSGGANSNSTYCPAGCGTVFKITTAGTLTTLYSFCSQANCADGYAPGAGLVQATDGNFYGTAGQGGAYGSGTVFEITATGRLTTLHSFDSTDGAYPEGLIQATDRNFYGTAGQGGAYGWGTVFEITPEGTLATLYSFTIDAAYPAGLIQAIDGNFYGTTEGEGGIWGWGTVFEITPEGTLTTLHGFDLTDGGNPLGGLIQATDGNFYGTTAVGGAHRNRTWCGDGCGTVFEITPEGTLTTLYSFCSRTNCTDGSSPLAGLVQATDGNFYGTTFHGGASGPCSGGCGTIFTFGPPAVTLSHTSFRFANQALTETSAAKTVTLKNSGTAVLTMSGITINGNFAISANTCAEAALTMDEKCSVSVTFTPTVLGKQTGTLTFTDNAANSPQTLSLSGTGVEPATLTPASASYGAQGVATTSAAKTFTLTNNQTVTLTSIAITITGDFAVSATTCSTSLGAKGKCTISVTFTPTATGSRTGQLSVSDSASNSPQTSSLKGTGQ